MPAQSSEGCPFSFHGVPIQAPDDAQSGLGDAYSGPRELEKVCDSTFGLVEAAGGMSLACSSKTLLLPVSNFRERAFADMTTVQVQSLAKLASAPNGPLDFSRPADSISAGF